MKNRIRSFISIMILIGLSFFLIGCTTGTKIEDTTPTQDTKIIVREVYVSPTGTGDGNTYDNPASLISAKNNSSPGDVILMLDGIYNLASTFNINNSGTEANPIVYKSFTPFGAIIVFNSTSNTSGFQISNSVGYITIQDIVFNGQNNGDYAIHFIRGSHHGIVSNCHIMNWGDGGIGISAGDYITVTDNRVFHCGYNVGWGSGIGFNNQTGMVEVPFFYDQNPGFHNVIARNIVSGTYDNSEYQSDGNGIIMDRYGNGPLTLIANNVIYQNAGRGIVVFRSQNVWIVNNTIYKNGLDTEGQDRHDEIILNGEDAMHVNNIHLINNAIYAWENNYVICYHQTDSVYYSKNVYFGGKGFYGVPSAVTNDPNQIRQTDPLFNNPPVVDIDDSYQYLNALDPLLIDDRFKLQNESTLINAGIDPKTAPGMNTNLLIKMTEYLGTDILGNPRPSKGAYDIGAYESP